MQDLHELSKHELEDPMKDSLVCHQEIPIRWRILDHAISDGEWMTIHNDNIKLMEVLINGDDTVDIEQQRDKEVFKEIRKLDAKLNLMMSWLGRILWQEQEMPALQTVSLSAKGMLFHNGAWNHRSKDALPNRGANELNDRFNNLTKTPVIAENDELFMELFLEPRYPHPFTTLAKVFHVDSQNNGQELLVRFIHMSEQNQQWLDKYVFRLHRRQVAMARKNPPPFDK
jgi:hypothetical protein